MMDLVEAALEKMDPPVKFHRLDGSMNVVQRKKALKSFKVSFNARCCVNIRQTYHLLKDDPNCMVLVMSLKVCYSHVF